MLDPYERMGSKDADPELLGEFARESGLAGFTRHELSAGKLPQALEVRPP